MELFDITDLCTKAILIWKTKTLIIYIQKKKIQKIIMLFGCNR